MRRLHSVATDELHTAQGSHHEGGTPRSRVLAVLGIFALLAAMLAVGPLTTAGAQGTPSIKGSINSDWIASETGGFGPSVDIQVRTSGGALKSSFTVSTDGGGGFFAQGEQVQADLMPGDVITATDGTTTRVLTLVTLTFDVLERFSNLASGTAPPGAMVQVGIGGAPQAFVVVADGSGNWTANFDQEGPNGEPRFDIPAASGSSAEVFEPDGDVTFVDGPFEASIPTCNGVPGTIFGTSGRDVIEGTDGPDVIIGFDGNDVIRGRGGNDIICGDNGRDRLFGGQGADALFGGLKNDILKGDGGPDNLFGERGRDRLTGGGGNDNLTGGSGSRDRLIGKGGIDICIDNQPETVRETCEA